MRCHGIHSLGTRLSPYLLDGRLNEGQASSPVQEDTDTYPYRARCTSDLSLSWPFGTVRKTGTSGSVSGVVQKKSS
jgi:hypothetical protein